MNFPRSTRSILLASAIAATPVWAAPGDPGVGDPISFATSGSLTLTYNGSNGGFDHVLELASSAGAVGTPIFVATSFPDSAAVLGYTPATPGDTFALGAYTAGTELIFRMTNVESARLGTPGTIAGQLFSGTSSALNPGGVPFVLVTPGGLGVLDVGFEDLVPSRDTYNNLSFTVEVAPIPEPHEWAMMLAGLGLVGVIARRRRVRRD